MNWNDAVIEQFRAGDERIADRFERSTLVLLHTTGARTGQERISPVACFADGDTLVVAASAAGRDEHPAWYHNLVANPQVTVERWEDGELRTFPAHAGTASGERREDLWDKLVAFMPGFADYKTKTTREIPMVELTRS